MPSIVEEDIYPGSSLLLNTAGAIIAVTDSWWVGASVKLSEKSLELNVGAELLALMRGQWGMPKSYLRGLTQREEKQEGVDFYVQLDPQTKLYAFQFKAPKGKVESAPYRYTLMREQHDLLFGLSQLSANSVFYVFPFYVTPKKLQTDVPQLLNDTWLAELGQMPTAPSFGSKQSRTIRCQAGSASINPEYKLQTFTDISSLKRHGIPIRAFASWYERSGELVARERNRNPWLVRGLRLVISAP